MGFTSIRGGGYFRMNIDISILQLTVSVVSALGIGGVLKWLMSIENRITRLETTCRLKNRICDSEGNDYAN